MLYWFLVVVLLPVQPELETGRTRRQEGRLDEAAGIFEQILDSRPDDLEARRELGHTWVLAGRYDQALRAYEKLSATADTSWQMESLKWTGLTKIYLGDFETSISRLEQLATLARRSNDRAAEVFSTWYRGHIYTELAQFGRANSAFLEGLELAPDDLNVLHLAGVLAARQGDEGSLRYQIEDLQQLASRCVDASQMRRVYHLQAEHALMQGQPKTALARIEQANKLMSHPLYREAMARARLALEEPEAAEAAYREIVSSTDARLDIPLYYVKALLGLARVLDARGESEEARLYYQRYLSHWGGRSDPLPGVSEAMARLSELGTTR